MMVINTLVEYSFWTPVLLWVGLHFWFRNVSYVVFLKNQLDRGEKWAYVLSGFVKNPGRVSFLRFCDYLFTVITSVATSATVVWTLQKIGLGANAYYGFISVIVFIWIAHLMKRRTELKLTDLFQSAFYLEYRWVNYEIRNAHLQGKQIIGIYDYGCKDKVELPEAYKRYGGSPIGWNSLGKLSGMLNGDVPIPEAPDSTPSGPIYNIIPIICR